MIMGGVRWSLARSGKCCPSLRRNAQRFLSWPPTFPPDLNHIVVWLLVSYYHPCRLLAVYFWKFELFNDQLTCMPRVWFEYVDLYQYTHVSTNLFVTFIMGQIVKLLAWHCSCPSSMRVLYLPSIPAGLFHKTFLRFIKLYNNKQLFYLFLSRLKKQLLSCISRVALVRSAQFSALPLIFALLYLFLFHSYHVT